ACRPPPHRPWSRHSPQRRPRSRRPRQRLRRRQRRSPRRNDRPIGNFDRLKLSPKWPMTLFNNYFGIPDHNKKRLIDIGF
ncbi:hypothetical protein, partial [Burkholderia diffusa]|uniref:hypothetical protein n=1 Tax=Burkholderia diffusa TaxID=488732 RepID=UPI001BA683E0